MKVVIVGLSIFIFNVYAFADENNGFRDIKWEESINKYKSVMHLTSDETKPNKFYSKENDDMSFGDIKLDSLVYVFYKGKLSSVIFQTDKSLAYSNQLLETFKNKFGNPIYSNKYTKKFRWNGSSTNVSLKCYSSSHKCSVIFDSVVMSNLKKIDSNTNK